MEISDAGVIHSPDNASDHYPIFCVLRAQKENIFENENSQKMSKPSWSKASEDEKEAFKHFLGNKLDQLKIPESLRC